MCTCIYIYIYLLIYLSIMVPRGEISAPSLICIHIYIYMYTQMLWYVYIYIYIYIHTHMCIYICIHYARDRAELAVASLLHVLLTRQEFIHIHQSISTVSNSKQVYCILNNWCTWINLSCGCSCSIL